jgi:protein-L-isoaspartate O-methyltransferase
MSDLQSAIAGLNTVDIEGDPIDALDACLMVLESMAVRPKNKLNEYVFTEDEQYEQYQKNLKNFWGRIFENGRTESSLDIIRDIGMSYAISRPFGQEGLGHLSEEDQLISQTLKPAKDDFFTEIYATNPDGFKKKSLAYLVDSPIYSKYGADFFDFARNTDASIFLTKGIHGVLDGFKSKDLVFGLPDYLQDWDVVKREMIDWLFANVSEAAMRDFAKNSPSDLLEKYGTIENMKAQLMRLPEAEPTQPAPQIIEHATGRGKTLRGIVRTDLTKAQAQEIDPYTFKKDGGWFIREKYLDQAQGGAVEPQPQANTEPDFTPTASGFVHDDDNAPKPPYNKLQPSFAVERGSKMDIKYDVKESKKLLATALKEAFPGTKFGIRNTYSQYGQGYVVYWTDGPSQGMVNRILSHFISYRDGDLDHTMDYRLPGNDKAARDSDGKLVYYGLYKLDAARSLTKDFAEKLLSSLAEKRWSVNPDNPESLIADPNGDVYSITDGSGLTNHYIISPVFSGGFRINEYDYSGRGFHRKTDLIETYSERQYGPATVVKRAKRGDLSDVPSTSDTLEPNSTTGSGLNPEQRATGSNADGSGQPESMAGSSGGGPDDGNGMQRNGGTVLPEDDGTRSGTTSDPDVSNGSGQRGTGGRANTSVSGGSSSTNGGRSSAVKRRNRAVAESATQDRTPTDLEATQRQASTHTTWADKASIDASLPYLLPEQRDDVLKAEQRLIDQNKAGMLFTNGTGTGKTFTGLGAAKRFINAGKKNILIVTMNDKIARDFVKSGNPLGIQIKQLDGIQDNGGGGAVVTTFANMGQNDSLGMIDWDLILIDEAHNLMQGEKADTTNALKKLRALSGHHSGFYDWLTMRHADKQPKPTGKDENGNDVYADGAWDDWRTFAKPLQDEWKANWTKQSQRTKVVFLSATPFSYVKTLDWAEGYLFNFVEPERQFDDSANSSDGYNQSNPRAKFYMSNFGYRMRYNKLNAPDAKVNSGVMERAFAEKLKTSGAISGRLLTVKFDYDRKFILIDSEVGKQIDEGFRFLRESKNSLGNRTYSKLSGTLDRRFDYLARLQLLEAIKADAAVDMIKKHMALGRKVLVFHDYNSGGSTNPFVLDGTTDAVEKAEYDLFKKMRPDLIGLNLNLPSPIVRLKQAFPNALQFNGRISKTERSKNADLFNADSSGPILMIAQSDAAATGISFHDTTGKHQRVLINIGMPAKPAKLRQTEGRIYRVGQSSNAINRYLTTGTDWERQAFAQKIAERAETVDNLSQGEDALVSIKDALIKSYEAAAYEDPSRNDGIGGKAYDEENARNNSLSPFDRAKTHYWAKAKERAKRGDRAGVDWYATPEPLGLKMVEWSGARKGDDVLELSAGDGAIGRYMPKDASVTFIEESQDLASRALMNNTDANVITDRFENHDKVNKYDCIVMNPPFGSGGATASSHVAKSVDHLRDGGRLVALLPVGQMDARLEKMEQQGYLKDMYKVAEITLPSVTFEKAGTGVHTKVTIWQKHENQADAPQSVIRRDYSHITDVEELFDAIQDLNLPKRPPRQDEELAMYGLQIYPERKRYVITGEGLQNEKIRNIVGGYAQKDGDDFVDWRNRGKLFLKQIKEAGVKPLYPQP